MKASRFLITTAFVLTLNASAAEPWSQEPKMFRGIAFGSSLAETKSILGRYNSQPAACDSGQCFQRFYIGDIETSQWFTFRDDKLVKVRLSFPSDSFNTLRDIFIERYGEPTEHRTEEVKTKGGGSYADEILVWLGNSVEVNIRRYSNSINDGGALVADRAWLEAEKKAEDEAKKKAAASF